MEGRTYHEFGEIEASFLSGAVPADALKTAVSACLNRVLDPVRAEFATQERQELTSKAYPAKEATGDAAQGGDSFTTVVGALRRELAGISQRDVPALRAVLGGGPDAPAQPLRSPKVLWSVRTAARPHLGHLMVLRRLAKLAAAGSEVSLR